MTTTTSDELQRLRQAISELEGMLPCQCRRDDGGYLFTVCVAGYIREILEAAASAAATATSTAPRLVHVPARLALEAAQDFLLLTHHGSRQDNACRVRLAELLDNYDAHALANSAFQRLGRAPLPPIEPVEAIIEREGKVLEHFEPGVLARLRAVLLELIRQRRSGRYHWSGMRRGELMAALERSNLGYKEVHTSWYNVLSLTAHPSPRMWRNLMRADASGSIQLQIVGLSDVPFGNLALQVATFSATVARLELRQLI